MNELEWIGKIYKAHTKIQVEQKSLREWLAKAVAQLSFSQ